MVQAPDSHDIASSQFNMQQHMARALLANSQSQAGRMFRKQGIFIPTKREIDEQQNVAGPAAKMLRPRMMNPAIPFIPHLRSDETWRNFESAEVLRCGSVISAR